MLKKFRRPLVVAGTGLIVVTSGLWLASTAVTRKQASKLDARAASYIQQHPKSTETQQNDAAKELEYLASTLGIYNIDGLNKEAAPIPDPVQAAAYEAIGKELTDYLKAQAKKPQGPPDPLPSNLQQFLDENLEAISQVQTHLLTSELPVWNLDVAPMADFFHANPSFLELISVQRLLLLKATHHSAQNQPTEMAAALESSLLLNEALSQRPELITYLVSLISMGYTTGLMRQLEGVPVELSNRLLALDQQTAAVDYLEFENWIAYQAMRRATQEGFDLYAELAYDPGLLWLGVIRTPFRDIYLNFSGTSLASNMASAYQQLGELTVCTAPLAEINNQIGASVPWWNGWKIIDAGDYPRQWQKGGHAMLAAELTHLVVQAKALANEQGQWPETLPDLSSQTCPDAQWVYDVTSDNELKISFSQDLPWLPTPSNSNYSQPALSYQEKKSEQ